MNCNHKNIGNIDMLEGETKRGDVGDNFEMWQSFDFGDIIEMLVPDDSAQLTE